MSTDCSHPPRRRGAAWLLALTLLVCCVRLQAATIYYPRPEGQADNLDYYAVELLMLALQKAGAHYQLKLTDDHMKQSRAVLEIARGKGLVDIMVTMTSREREHELLPIRIPVSKGLVGWRLALVRADRVEQFKQVRKLDQLKAYMSGQGHDWPDTEILRASGLPVQPVVSYDGLFAMLAAGRIAYFPRSMREIWPELDSHPGLAVDPYLALRYRTTDYYFVNRTNAKLAEEVRRGLELALADGSFNRLFFKYFAEPIKRAQLERRRIIDLPNPLLTPETPLDRKELWFSLDDLKQYLRQ